MAALGGTVYDPPLTAMMTLTTKKGKKSVTRTYGVAIHGEHDGVWVVKHGRPSGEWDREHRAAHAGTKGHKGNTTITHSGGNQQ